MAAHNSRYEDGKFLVELTNSMFSQLHVEQRVQHWSDINAHVFVTLFEGINGEPLRDVIRHPRTKEDEVHNVQVVIDTLSLDLLHISLSHITGEDVVSGNKRAIGNLMEVILGLLEFILEGIGSDLSSEISEETQSADLIEDPDMLTGELIDEILEQELNKKCHIGDTSQGTTSLQGSPSHKRTNGEPTIVGHGTTRSAWEPSSRAGLSDATGNSTADLIALGRSSLDDPSHFSADNTADLVALGDSRYGPASPPHRESRRPPAASSLYNSEKQTIPKDVLRDRGAPTHGSRVSTSQGTTNVATVSPTKNLSSPLDSSLASSVTRPEHPSLSGGPPTSEFASLGMRPRTTPHPSYFGAGQVGDGMAGVSGSSLGNMSDQAATSFTHHLYHHFDRTADRAGVNLPDFSSSLPLDQSRPQGYPSSRDPSGRVDGVSTLPTRSYDSNSKAREERRTGSSQTQRPASLGLKSHSYDNLQNLMQDTVALSRAAVQTSPLRHPGSAGSSGSRTGSSDSQDISAPMRQVLKRIDKQSQRILALSGEDSKTTQPAVTSKGTKAAHRPTSATGPSKATTSPKGIFSPSRRADGTDKAGKKVSFHVTQTSGEKSSSQMRPRQTNTSPRSSTVHHSSTFPAPSHRTSLRSNTARSLFAPPPNAEYKPQTFSEYLDKYYGIVDHRDRLESTNGEETPKSDSAFELSDASPGRGEDYSGDADSGEEVDSRRSRRPQRSVHFDDVVQQRAPRGDRVTRTGRTGKTGVTGRMAPMQRQLNTETKAASVKTKAMAKLYDMELEDFEEDVKDHMKSTRQKGRSTERDYKKKVLRQPKTNKYKPARKYQTSVLRPRVRTRSSSATGRGHKSPAVRSRKRSASASPAVGRRQRRIVRPSDDDLLPWLLEEFPFLHLSTETLHELWRKSSKQIEQLSKAHQEVRRKKTKAQVQIEEAERRQSILMDIMKKELSHNQRMKDIKDRLSHQQSVRTQLRNRRQQSARSRRYYDEFQVQQRSKMLKKRTREEQVFKHLFKDGLEIQRDRIRELRRYAKEEREHRAERQQNELESIENYYRDQFAMLTEVIGRERKDIETKDQAQTKVVSQMKKELRQKMERDIRALQEQLYRDEDEEYFRQLDADRLREELQVSRYQLRG